MSRSWQPKPRTEKMSSSKEARPPVIHWFRKDLRLADNPALLEAAESGRPVAAVYILEDGDSDPWPPGGAGRWWLHHSLASLDDSLKKLGNRLILRRGRPGEILPELARETGAEAVHVARLAEPHARELGGQVDDLLKPLGVRLRVFGGNLLFPPEKITTKKGDPFKIFTPFYKACLKKLPPGRPLPAPARLPRSRSPVKGDSLNDWELLPEKPDWSAGWLDLWTPGEQGALARLEAFSENSAAGYQEKRDRPDLAGTSRLSPHLHFGEISARACWHGVTSSGKPEAEKGAESFLRQIVWREFSRHLLYHWPTFPEKPFRREFEHFPWTSDKKALGLWQHGRTGYPIVDAGMRELWATGWMHNRVRMIVASFLVKHLLIPWQDGAAWFWDTLVDADLANNSVSWQWVAGCGVDAAPFFRIFNPIVQGRKFDPDGVYVRRWVPELARLPNRHVHEPWKASKQELEKAGILLGGGYPFPVVDHAMARVRALDAFKQMRK